MSLLSQNSIVSLLLSISSKSENRCFKIFLIVSLERLELLIIEIIGFLLSTTIQSEGIYLHNKLSELLFNHLEGTILIGSILILSQDAHKLKVLLAIVIFIYFLGHHTFLFQLLMDVIGVLIFLFMFYKKAKSKKLFLIASVISALVFYFVFPW